MCNENFLYKFLILAPPTHAPATNRNVPHPQTDARRDNTGGNAPGHAGLPDERVANVGGEHESDVARPRTVRKQESRSSLLSQHATEEPTYDSNQYNELQPEHTASDYDGANVEQSKVSEEVDDVYKDNIEKPMEVEHTQEYEATDQDYTAGNYENYDANYEQPEVTAKSEYPNQEYEQNYEEPTYTEGQYENYEQQPQYDNYPQQYTDPNAQYEGQYENYAADGNYQVEGYENTQQNQEYAPQNVEAQDYVSQNEEVRPESQDVLPNTFTEIKSSSPKDNIPSQS